MAQRTILPAATGIPPSRTGAYAGAMPAQWGYAQPAPLDLSDAGATIYWPIISRRTIRRTSHRTVYLHHPPNDIPSRRPERITRTPLCTPIEWHIIPCLCRIHLPYSIHPTPDRHGRETCSTRSSFAPHHTPPQDLTSSPTQTAAAPYAPPTTRAAHPAAGLPPPTTARHPPRRPIHRPNIIRPPVAWAACPATKLPHATARLLPPTTAARQSPNRPRRVARQPAPAPQLARAKRRTPTPRGYTTALPAERTSSRVHASPSAHAVAIAVIRGSSQQYTLRRTPHPINMPHSYLIQHRHPHHLQPQYHSSRCSNRPCSRVRPRASYLTSLYRQFPGTAVLRSTKWSLQRTAKMGRLRSRLEEEGEGKDRDQEREKEEVREHSCRIQEQ